MRNRAWLKTWTLAGVFAGLASGIVNSSAGEPRKPAPSERERYAIALRVLKARPVRTTKIREALRVVAESKSKGARAALREFCGDEKMINALWADSMKQPPGSAFTVIAVLKIIAGSACPYAGEFLLEDLEGSKAFGSFNLNKTNFNNLVAFNNHARFSALGHLKSPSAKTYSFFARVLKEHTYEHDKWGFYSPDEVLAQIGSDRAKNILWAYYLRRCEKPLVRGGPVDEKFVPVYLRRFRDRPAMFELMVDFGIRFKDRTKSQYLFAGIAAGRWVAGEHGVRQEVPRYESVASKHAARYVAAIDRLLAVKDVGKYIKPKPKRLNEIRSVMAKRAAEHRSSGESKETRPDKEHQAR